MKTSKYSVEKRVRTGIASFVASFQTMTKEELQLSLPTWEGQPLHRVGNTIYLIKEINQSKS